VRRSDPADRRVKLAAATDDGIDLAHRLRAALGFAREPLAGLTTVERTLLRDLLQRMLGEEGGDESAEKGAEKGREADRPGTG
jgi:DNA-binding MarR family transcriptional regulator